jgi:transposase
VLRYSLAWSGYQPPENLTPGGGLPKRRERDSMRHAVDSWRGQHVDNRDYTQRSECFAVTSEGGAHGRRQAGAAPSGHCHGASWAFAAAAQAGGMDRQTPCDWVIRYNADGLAGLADRPRPGRRPRLAEAQLREVAKWVEDGPDLKTDGVMRWRRADLGDRIAAKFDVHLHERGVGKLPRKLNFGGMSVRPAPAKRP